MNNHPVITYINLKENINGKEQISQDYNIYDYFSKKINVEPQNLCIKFDGEICGRDLYFTNLNPMTDLVFYLYDMEWLIKSFEDDKQKMLQIQYLCQESTQRFSGQLSQNTNRAALLQSIIMSHTIRPNRQISQESQKIQENQQSLDLKYISVLDGIIQHQEYQKKRYENLRKTKIHKILLDSQSLAQDMSYQCYICNEQITENSLQTRCQHNFHQSCFEEYVDQLRFQRNAVFYCYCGQKQALVSLLNFLNKLQRGKIIVEEFLINQLNKIKESQKYRIQQCKICDYFCIPKGQWQNQQFFCPKCND